MTSAADAQISNAVTYTVTAAGATSASGAIGVTVRKQTWSPACLGTSVTLWLDAADATTLFSDSACTTATTSGGVVGCWKDKSSSARDAIQATASLKPLFGLTGFNGKPGVISDGVDDMLDQVGTSSVLPNVNNFTHTFAFRFLNGSGAFIEWNTPGDYNGIMPDHLAFGTLLGGGSAPWIGQGGPVVKTFGARGGANVAAVGTAQRTVGGVTALFIDGSATASRSAATPAGMANGRYRLFGRTNVTQFAQTETGEYVAVDYGAAALSSAHRDRLEGYLAHKWGTNGLLPAGHTYKASPP
jgi:hypothetical protein